MPQFVRLLTTKGAQFINIHFIQSIKPSVTGVIVRMPDHELVVKSEIDTYRLARATKLPIDNMKDPYEGKEDDFKLSLWM